MKAGHLALSAFFLLGSAGPCAADWQFTRWGMTVEEAVRAAGAAGVNVDAGGTVPSGDGKLTKLPIPYYKVGSIFFDISLVFESPDNRLVMVLMTVSQRGDFDRQKLDALRMDLLQAFGSPFAVNQQDGFDLAMWRDVTRNNRIFAKIRVDPPGRTGGLRDTSIMYTPLVPVSAF
ncbi:MAG TPA: hypothetical protein VD995_03260 [Azospirillum sp.]|nr:hypothetical protein [Azospirillum sp.]